MYRRSWIRRLATTALALGAAAATWAQDSNRPISLVVGYSAGGSADFVARAVGAEMARRLGRQVVVENVAGASGMIAAQKVLSGPADGSMVYMGGTDTVIVPMVNNKVRIDWEKDYAPLGRMTTLPMVFAVPASSRYNSLAELAGDLRKTRKEDFSYATPGIATMQHLYGALINQNAQVAMLHVPYKGGNQIATDLVGRQVDSAVLVLSTAMPFLKDGKIKALSISDTARSPQLPNVPRIGEEEGFAGVSLPLWQGLFVKAGTPAPVVAALEQALLASLDQPELRARLAESGVTVSPLNGAELRNFVRPQATLYRNIVQTARITTE
jgi:tripartite-type tricarboxylate transporter receptor subunit TctC